MKNQNQVRKNGSAGAAAHQVKNHAGNRRKIAGSATSEKLKAGVQERGHNGSLWSMADADSEPLPLKKGVTLRIESDHGGETESVAVLCPQLHAAIKPVASSLGLYVPTSLEIAMMRKPSREVKPGGPVVCAIDLDGAGEPGRSSESPKEVVVLVDFTPEERARLERVAGLLKITPERLIQRAVDYYMADDARLADLLEKGVRGGSSRMSAGAASGKGIPEIPPGELADLRGRALRLTPQRATGKSTTANRASDARSVKQLALALQLGPKQEKALELLAGWEGETPEDYCRDGIRSRLEATRDDLEFFVTAKGAPRKEVAWAKKFFSRVAPLFKNEGSTRN